MIHDEAGQYEEEGYRGPAAVQNVVKAFRGDGSESVQVGDDDAERRSDAQGGQFRYIVCAGSIQPYWYSWEWRTRIRSSRLSDWSGMTGSSGFRQDGPEPHIGKPYCHERGYSSGPDFLRR